MKRLIVTISFCIICTFVVRSYEVFALPPGLVNETSVGVKVTWKGNYPAVWDGHLHVTGARIAHFDPISFESDQDEFLSSGKAWKSFVEKPPWQYKMYGKQQDDQRMMIEDLILIMVMVL